MNDTKELKQGAVREDGYRFVGYKRSVLRKDGSCTEQWLCPSSFHRWKLKRTLTNCRKRAAEFGVPFNLDLQFLLDIYPHDSKCPVLGIEMEWNSPSRLSAPSLDRLNPRLGYVKGNVAWISLHANRLKDNASLQELEAVIQYIKSNLFLKEAA